jgi:hypothetical protein
MVDKDGGCLLATKRGGPGKGACMLGEIRARGIESGRKVAWMIALVVLGAAAISAPCAAHAAEVAQASTAVAESADATPAAAAAESAAVAPAEPADRVALGVDLVSRYAWRGQVYGDSPCFQPWAGISFVGFTLGTWGSFPFTPVHTDTTTAPDSPEDATSTTEVDVSLSRSLTIAAGTFTAAVTDYHYPSAGQSYFEFSEDGTGGHIVDVGLTYQGPETLPLGLCGSINVYNDDDHAAYVEASWPFTAGTTEVSLVAGAALGKSALYDVEKDGVHFVNTAVTASKPWQISDSFAPVLKVSWIVNPYRERTILVAAISL